MSIIEEQENRHVILTFGDEDTGLVGQAELDKLGLTYGNRLDHKEGSYEFHPLTPKEREMLPRHKFYMSEGHIVNFHSTLHRGQKWLTMDITVYEHHAENTKNAAKRLAARAIMRLDGIGGVAETWSKETQSNFWYVGINIPMEWCVANIGHRERLLGFLIGVLL